MDPNFNGVWSIFEIDMVRSFIASRSTNYTYTNDPNKKHNDIVDELQTWFPGKERQQITQLYVHLVVEMNTVQSNNQQVEPSNAEGSHKLNTVPMKKRQNPVIAWTEDEHKNFLRGLEVCGRGSWKNISRYFVPTRTPIQICSHAQKYFHRKECTTRKQRFSINDVGLYDTEPWVQKNSSSLEALAFGHSAYNTNYYEFEGQHTVMNKLTHVSDASTTRGQHIIGSSSIDPTTVQSKSLGWEALGFPSGANSTNYYEFDGQHDVMNNLTCADQTSPVAPMTVQNNSPSWETLSFAGSSYNRNYYDGQQVALNNITRGETMVSKNQVVTYTKDQLTSTSSSVVLVLERAGSHHVC